MIFVRSSQTHKLRTPRHKQNVCRQRWRLRVGGGRVGGPDLARAAFVAELPTVRAKGRREAEKRLRLVRRATQTCPGSASASALASASLRHVSPGLTDARSPCISCRAAAFRTQSPGARSSGTRSPRSTRTCSGIRSTTASPRRPESSTGRLRRSERELRCPERWPGRWRRHGESSLVSSASSSMLHHSARPRQPWRAAGGVAARSVTRRGWHVTRTSSCGAPWRPRSTTSGQHGAARRVARRVARRAARRPAQRGPPNGKPRCARQAARSAARRAARRVVQRRVLQRVR